jgi:hypothetical protein
MAREAQRAPERKKSPSSATSLIGGNGGNRGDGFGG